MTRVTAFLLPALRRFAVLLAGVSATTLVLSLLLGALAKWNLNRSISTGFELGGIFLLVVGFFVGNRGPTRLRGASAPFFGTRMVRLATHTEREETLSESAIFVVIGLILVILGVAIDSRYRLL